LSAKTGEETASNANASTVTHREPLQELLYAFFIVAILSVDMTAIALRSLLNGSRQQSFLQSPLHGYMQLPAPFSARHPMVPERIELDGFV
jgi:hypothetical protein